MRALTKLAFAAAAAFITQSFALPVTPVHPGNAMNIIITSENTVNATNPAPLGDQPQPGSTSTSQTLPMAFVNNLSGGSVNAYVTGLNSDNQLVMLMPNGQFFFPTASSSQSTPQPITGNVAIPLGGKGSTTSITIPGFISAARVWFAEGELQFFTVFNSATGGPSLVEPSTNNPSDPNANVNFGFIELTTNASGIFANISYVDFLGLPLGMSLQSSDGTQTAEGVGPGAVAALCSALETQSSKDGQPWTNLCQTGSNGSPLRVTAPIDYISVNPNAFDSYWTSYAQQVFTHYETNTLTIDTQAAAGNVACTVSNNMLNCAGDNRGYAMPAAVDIFGCNSGPFAIESGDNDVHVAVVPRLCAAFNRGTLLLSGGNVQPNLGASSYYTTAPNNFYSKFVHEQEIDGKGYAFSYDDVTPNNAPSAAGSVSDGNPELLTITVGGE